MPHKEGTALPCELRPQRHTTQGIGFAPRHCQPSGGGGTYGTEAAKTVQANPAVQRWSATACQTHALVCGCDGGLTPMRRAASGCAHDRSHASRRGELPYGTGCITLAIATATHTPSLEHQLLLAAGQLPLLPSPALLVDSGAVRHCRPKRLLSVNCGGTGVSRQKVRLPGPEMLLVWRLIWRSM